MLPLDYLWMICRPNRLGLSAAALRSHDTLARSIASEPLMPRHSYTVTALGVHLPDFSILTL